MRLFPFFAMTHVLLLAGLVAVGAARGEGVASSASSAGSASVGSISGSINRSSNSSSDQRDVAEGDYRVVEVTESTTHAGMLRVALENTAHDGFVLELPRHALTLRALAADDTVHVSRRPYGLAFAYADTRQDFFLVLTDDWRRELDPRPVTL